MGEAAAKGADVVVITSDNPRTEDPSAIVAQVALGARGARELVCLPDRSEAIAHAVGKAEPRDIVLVAGKGHEDYQIVGTRKQPYSDLAQVRSALAGRERR